MTVRHIQHQSFGATHYYTPSLDSLDKVTPKKYTVYSEYEESLNWIPIPKPELTNALSLRYSDSMTVQYRHHPRSDHRYSLSLSTIAYVYRRICTWRKKNNKRGYRSLFMIKHARGVCRQVDPGSIDFFNDFASASVYILDGGLILEPSFLEVHCTILIYKFFYIFSWLLYLPIQFIDHHSPLYLQYTLFLSFY